MTTGAKVVLGLVGVVVLGFLGFVTLWTMSIHVGYLHFALSYGGLAEDAERAMAYPMEPGQKAMLTTRDGELVPGHGQVVLTRKADGDRLVTIDCGGGHIGNQGYLYVPYEADEATVLQDAFGGFEGREVGHLVGDWWYYDSTEE